MIDTKDYWKVSNGSEVILTFAAPEYGIDKLLTKIQSVIGKDFCSFQKFDERFDKIEDFDNIFRTGFNYSGTRLLTAHLFEYDSKKNVLTVDRKRSWKIVRDYEFTYSILSTIIKCIGEWEGLRRHILWTMCADTCWTFWGDAQFGESFLVPEHAKKEYNTESTAFNQMMNMNS